MSIKIVLLKSGEEIISDVKGLFHGEELVKYQLNKPCLIVINGEFRITEPGEEDKENQMSVSLYEWPVVSKDEQVEVFPDWVMTIVSPTDELEEMYNNKILKNESREEGTESDKDDSAD